MEFSREMKMEILEECMNHYAPDESSQEEKRNKVLWIAQCILRDEEEAAVAAATEATKNE